MTGVKKISISLPKELCRELDRIASENRSSRSAVITSILKRYLGTTDVRRSGEYPTALSKLRSYSLLKLRSPKLARVRVRSDWVIESEL